jgi:hypothetical protein
MVKAVGDGFLSPCHVHGLSQQTDGLVAEELVGSEVDKPIGAMVNRDWPLAASAGDEDQVGGPLRVAVVVESGSVSQVVRLHQRGSHQVLMLGLFRLWPSRRGIMR